jgi:hypothetical protein
MKKIWKKCFRQKNQLFLLLLLLTVIQCKQRYIRTYIITLQCYRSGFKINFLISKVSKFSIMQDYILVVSDLVLCDNLCTIRGSCHDNFIHIFQNN